MILNDLIEVLLAAKSGKKIQELRDADIDRARWVDVDAEAWAACAGTIRVKPEAMELWVVTDGEYNIAFRTEAAASQRAQRYVPIGGQLKVTHMREVLP